jgi:tripartite-type tricarboxylate transporter receptor subunit TctC
MRMLSALVALLVSTVGAFAADYPCAVVRIVEPYPPGGSTDVIGRLVAERLQPALKTRVVIENRPGATGNIGTVAVINAKPDGCTLLVNAAVIATFPDSFRKLAYDPFRDLVPVGGLGETPTLVVTRATNSVKDAGALIRSSKEQPEGLTFSTPGYGLIQHLTVEELGQRTGAKFLFVPYKGAVESMADLITGRVDFASLSAGSVTSLLEDGKLKALGVFSSRRSAVVPEVPTLLEQGLPALDTIVYFLLFAPAATPKEIVSMLSAELQKIVGDPTLKERFYKIGFEPAPNPSEKVTEIMHRTREVWAPVIKRLGIKLD